MKQRTLLLLCVLSPLFLFSQNMQLADLYLTYSSYTAIIPVDSKTDLIATSWTESDKFYPDHRDFNTYIDNHNDAFLVWQEAQNHRYIKHVRFTGDSTQQIEQVWVSSNKDIFLVLSSSDADTISILGGSNSVKVVQPKLGETGLSYFLIKLDKSGQYQGHVFLGYYDFNSLGFLYPNHLDDTLHLRMYYSDSIHFIPGTTIKLQTPRNKTKTVAFDIDCENLKTSNIRHDSLITSPANRIGFTGKHLNNVECRYLSTLNENPYPDSVSCIVKFNKGYTDSIICSKNIQFGSNAFLNEKLYLTHTSDNNQEYSIANVKFPGKGIFISKWVNGQLVDSMTSTFHETKFFVDVSDKLFFHGYTVSLDYKPVNIKFLKGEPYIFKDDQVFRFWGPIESDSLKWISQIAGNAGPGGSIPYFYADSNAQYLCTNIKSWMDLDPGPYEWQFNPLTYDGKTVIAKYNCYPNAIFTFDQTAQKVQFYNFSSGGQTYKWLFGVGSSSSTDLNPIFKYPNIGDYEVTLIVYNECGSDTFTFPVSVDEMISVENVQIPDVRIYPNPTSKNLTVEHGVTNGSISLFDVKGKTIWTEKLENSIDQIDVSDVQAGMYILVVKGNQHTITRKLVIE